MAESTGLAIDREKPSTEEYHPDPEAQKIISLIQGKYEQKDSRKRAYEKTWFVSHAAVVGQHYLVWNDISARFETPVRTPAHRVRLVVNMMLAYYRRTRARLTVHRPGLHVAPATTDEVDVERARLSLHVLESEFERLAFQKILKEWVGWILEAGNGILHPWWNPWGGPPLTQEQPVMIAAGVDEMGQMIQSPQLDEMGQPVMEEVPVTDELGRQLHVGELCLDVVTPFEFDIDDRGSKIADAQWCRRDVIKPVSWVRETYPEMGKYVKSENVFVNQIYQKRHKQLVGIYGYQNEVGGGDDEERGPKDSVVVHEYWERPREKHAEGRMIVVAGGVLLHNGPNPYSKMREIGLWCPFVHACEVAITGRFWGQAMIEQAFPLNRNYNRARSQEVENRTLHGRPKILVPRTAKIRQDAFDAEAGEKVDYAVGPRGEKPELMYPQSTSTATDAELAHSMSDMQEVLSWHEASRGILPSANIPGIAVDKLQQADETALGDTESNIRDAIIELGRMVLCIVSEYWTEERLARATGEDGTVAAKRIKGEDLAGEDQYANYYDVRMLPQSTMWRDPEKQREMLDGLVKLGMLNPQDENHRKYMLKAMDQGSIEQIYKDDRLDEQTATQENEAMEQGVMPMPRDFENHEIHIHLHDRFRKSERYRALPPEAQAVYDQHVAAHKQLMVAVAQQQAQMQIAAQAPVMAAQQAQAAQGAQAQGGPPAPGGPSQPS